MRHKYVWTPVAEEWPLKVNPVLVQKVPLASYHLQLMMVQLAFLVPDMRILRSHPLEGNKNTNKMLIILITLVIKKMSQL